MIVIAVIFSIGYVFLLGWFLIGWLNLKSPLKKIIEPVTRFSIIIPARNEEDNMINTIEDLAGQYYPHELFEVIIIDDDSTDQTYQISHAKIEAIKTVYPNFRLLKTPADVIYTSGHKKHAIEYGVDQAENEWIITTDADCRRGKFWLSSIAGFIKHENPVLVSAPVLFQHERSIFQKIQSLEFLSLVGMGAAAIGNGSPNLCNGANLVYKKSAFYEVGGFSDNLELSSGDDEFLMHKIAATHPGKIHFLKNKEAFVFTQAHKTLKDFIRQRKRWVSKSTKYRKKEVTGILVFVYVFHFLVLSIGLLSIFLSFFLLPFLILIGTKIVAECALVIPLSRFFGKLRFIPLYPIAAIFYIPYVVSIGIIGNSGRYVWKGREVN
jgi:cellulose synthase/poly-beta-1,6-N-acetylglucosamine synthase-like glycosyltransferase